MTVSPTNGISLASGDGTYVNETGDETITGSLTVTKDQNSDTTLNVDNGTSATAARAEISVTANASSGGLYQLSSGYTSSGSMQADSTVLESASTASGGLILSAGGSNNLSLYTNDSLAAKVNAIQQIVSIGGAMTSRATVAGIAGSAADENSFELGEGYLNLSRNSTAETQQIRFNKDGSLHSGIKTNAAGTSFFGSDGNAKATIDTSGHWLVGTSDNTPYNNNSSSGTGAAIGPNGQIWHHAHNGDLGTWNRTGSDGSMFLVNRNGSTVGTVSVSSGVVTWGSFSGGHWSQLSDNSTPEIPKGTVVSTIQEMYVRKVVEWTEDDGTQKREDYYGEHEIGDVFVDNGVPKTVYKGEHEQLAKFKISDIASDKAVYGVFSNWNEHGEALIHSVGANVVRVTGPCEIGDLLESAGDGTARVQADDIVRSTTLGKVTYGAPDALAGEENTLPFVCYCG